MNCPDFAVMCEGHAVSVSVRKTPEQRLRRLVRAEREARWLEQNKEAIAHYNRRVAEQGLLSDEVGML